MKPTIDQLPDKPQILRQMLLKALEKNRENEKEIRLLKQQMALYLSQKHGQRTEIHSGQGSLFNEAEVEAATVTVDPEEAATIPEQRRRKADRRPIPKNLHREEVIIDLPSEGKCCTAAGCNHAELQRVDDETSEQYDIASSRIGVLKTSRR